MVSVDQNIRYTYTQFYEVTEHAARALLAMGIVNGDRVGIWAPNRAEWVILQFATARIGAIMVTINPAYRVHELEYVLNQSEINAVFASLKFKTSHYKNMLEEVKDKTPSLEHIVIFEEQWDTFLGQKKKVSKFQLD